MNPHRIVVIANFFRLRQATLTTGVLFALPCISLPGYATQEVSVTPYRPTVTNSAGLSAPGWVELETGVAAARGKDGSHQDSLPYLLKLAFTPDFGVLLGGDAVVAQTEPGNARVSGGGDTTVLFKHRFAVDASAAAFGCEYGVRLPTAAKGAGSGKRDYVVNGIYSRNIGRHVLDVNLNATRLGEAAANESAYQYGWSGTVFHALRSGWGGMVELSGVVRRGTLPQNQWLVAASYEWSPRLVLDAGVSGGIGNASQRVTWFAGMSMLLGKVH